MLVVLAFVAKDHARNGFCGKGPCGKWLLWRRTMREMAFVAKDHAGNGFYGKGSCGKSTKRSLFSLSRLVLNDQPAAPGHVRTQADDGRKETSRTDVNRNSQRFCEAVDAGSGRFIG